MKLQISFDMNDLDKAMEIALQVAPHASILEIGSLLLYKNGVKALEKFREAFPDKTLLVDAKIVSCGKESVTLFANAGADWITVMAGTSKDVIHSACTAAHNLNKKVMIDLLDAASLGQSALEAKSLGADALLFYSPYDSEEHLVFVDKWDIVRNNTSLPIFVSYKITKDIIDLTSDINPDGIIIGKAITEAEDPAEKAQFFKEKFAEIKE